MFLNFTWQFTVSVFTVNHFILFTIICEFRNPFINCMSTSVVIMDLVNLFHVREFSIQGVGGRVLNFIEETKTPSPFSLPPLFPLGRLCWKPTSKRTQSKPRRYYPQSVVQKRCGRFELVIFPDIVFDSVTCSPVMSFVASFSRHAKISTANKPKHVCP